MADGLGWWGDDRNLSVRVCTLEPRWRQAKSPRVDVKKLSTRHHLMITSLAEPVNVRSSYATNDTSLLAGPDIPWPEGRLLIV
jgi:hypothetical protein